MTARIKGWCNRNLTIARALWWSLYNTEMLYNWKYCYLGNGLQLQLNPARLSFCLFQIQHAKYNREKNMGNFTNLVAVQVLYYVHSKIHNNDYLIGQTILFIHSSPYNISIDLSIGFISLNTKQKGKHLTVSHVWRPRF